MISKHETISANDASKVSDRHYQIQSEMSSMLRDLPIGAAEEFLTQMRKFHAENCK